MTFWLGGTNAHTESVVTATMARIFHWRFLYHELHRAGAVRLHDGLLSLIPAHCRAGDFDPHLVRNLQLHGVV